MIINPSSVEYLCKADPIFDLIKDKYGIPPNWQRTPGFISLARIILEQQVSLESAFAAYKKLQDRLGEITPHNILLLDDQEMRACYVSRQKTRYLRILSQAIIDESLDLAAIQNQPEPVVRQALTSLTGIGNWTADVYLLICISSPNLLPLGDVAVVNTIRELKGIAKKEDMEDGTQHWQPHRSAATFFLWHYYLNKRNRSVAYMFEE